jgi:hypothetical protein
MLFEFLMSNSEYGAAGSVESNANIQPGAWQYGAFGTFNENPTSDFRSS